MATPLDAITSALPPTTDPLTFLTILEYNLTSDLLPDLFKILQDPALTSTIGWDLISLLTPFLPASKDCLNEVARLGNPRECVLKATESLRLINFNQSPALTSPSTDPESQDDDEGPDSRPDHKNTPLLTFTALLSLLSTLHPRIKSARPSRFLSSTLQAVLATYTDATHTLPADQVDEITSEITRFIKTISGKKRPHLPPRKSTQDALPTLESGPDPEAQDEAPTTEELALTNRLLQSFTTHILEDYMLSLDDGLAWSARFDEKLHPERSVPGRKSQGQRYGEEPSLQARESTVGQLVAIAQDLDLKNEDLLKSILEPPPEPADVDGPPSAPSDIPLSGTGALFLLTARVAASTLFGATSPLPRITVFPDHANLVKAFVGVDGAENVGTESESVLDAVIALGLRAFDGGQVGDLKAVEDETFTQYLQTLSLVSANHPSSTIRYHAHLLCSGMLHEHPSDLVRLAFILDTLQDCPFENLKGSAVGWLKEETLPASSHGEDVVSVFATPVALDRLAPFLFPDLSSTLSTAPLLEAWTSLQASLPFHLATLNFYYLLLSARALRPLLQQTTLHSTDDVRSSFLEPLRQASGKFKESLTSTEGALAGAEGAQGAEAGLADLALLDDALERVAGAEKAFEAA
ncbi:MAG: hypothetical protein M1832_001889 [Thelocarpon impressellum]|nr:MAG: hypothetical protein M1832_001889 [Thelocarpon impressellum]